MKRHALFGVIVGLLSAADKEEAGKVDLKKMTGAWTMVSGEEEGKQLPKKTVKAARLTIKGDEHTVKVGEDTMKGTHKLDPTKKPKTIDVEDTEGPFKDKTLLGIYQFRDDEFSVCFAAPGKERPTEFTTKSGTGHMSHVWKRQKK